MGILAPNLRPDLDALRVDVAVGALRDVVKDGWSVLGLSTGMTDAFTDQAGIASLGGATYDGTNKLVSNAGGSTGNLVPTMTGNAAPSGVASSDSNGMGAPWQAFDGSNSTYWVSNSSPGSAWIQYQFASAQKITSYTIVSGANGASRIPSGWTLQGSSNGSAWVTLDTRSGQSLSAGTPYTYSFVNSTAYAYYRLNITATGGGYPEIDTWQMSGVVTPPAITVVSSGFALGFQPSAARVIAPMELGSGVMGTDGLFDLSRDGSNWASVPLYDLGKFDASTRIVGGLVSLEGQSAGTSIYWRWRTTAGIAQALHGVWLQCR